MTKTTSLWAGMAILFYCGSLAMLQAQQIRVPAARTLASATSVSGTASGAAPSGTRSPQPQLQQRYPRYVIQREDVLVLSFPLSPELNQTLTVQPDGFINLQTAGALHVQGLTVPELKIAVKKAYTGILHDPIINVDLKDFQKPFYTVSGQVGRPGKYNLRSNITIAQALAIAGGLASTAKSQAFLFHRSSNGWYEVEKVNLKDILSGKHLSEDARVQPGDMIYVPETFIARFRKYVPYSVSGGTYLQPNPF